MMRALMACAILSIGSVEAAADRPDWSALDLGRLYKNDHCMDAALSTYESLLAEVSISTLRRSEWITYADGIADGDHDALIICTYGDNRGTRATLIIYSNRNPVNARMITRRIAQIFEAEASRITKAWKQSF